MQSRTSDRLRPAPTRETHGRVSLAVAAVLISAVLFAIGYRLWPVGTDALAVEDGIVETAQAALLLLSSILLFLAAFRARGRSPWLGAFAFGFFVVAGEEISWGQRILGIDTPESLERANVQGELNLHNIAGINGSVRAVAVAGLVMIFMALPAFRRLSARVDSMSERLRLPDVPLLALVPTTVALAFMVGPRVFGNGLNFTLDEIGELYVYLALLLFAGVAFRRWVQQADRSTVTTSPQAARDTTISDV